MNTKVETPNQKAFIEDSAFYRGQIVYRWKRPSINKNVFSIFKPSINNFNPYCTFENYYGHQSQFVEHLQNGHDTLLMAPFNSGRTSISLLYALDVVFNKQKSVLFISINQFEKEIEKEFLKKTLIQSNYDWLVDINEIEYDDYNQALSKGIFPSIFIIQAKDLHSFLLPKHPQYSTFFESLGLIIFDDFEKYSGHPASNLHFTSKRLEAIHSVYNCNSDPIQYLITSKPFDESKGVVDSIFGRRFEIVHRDDRETNPANIYFWVPAFSKAEIKYGNKNQNSVIRKTIRESLIDDAYILAFESILVGKRTVLHYSGIPFSKNDIQIRERYINNITHSRVQDDRLLGNLFMGNDWGEITAELIKNDLNWDEIDTIIVACFTGSVNNLRDDLLHIGGYNAEIFVAMPQIPAYQFYINNPELNILKNIEETVKGEQLSIFGYNIKNNELKDKHLLLSYNEYKAFNNPECFDAFEKKWGNIFKECVNEDENFTRLKSLKGYDFFSSEIDEIYEIIDKNGDIVGTANKADIPDHYFKNSLISIDNQRFTVDALDIKNRKIVLNAINRFSLPISLREFEINKKETESNNLTFEKLQFSSKGLSISSSLNKYKVLFGTDTDPDSYRTISNNTDRIEGINLHVIELTGPKGINAAASILNTAIKTKIIINNLTPRYFTTKDTAYFYNLGTGDLSYLLKDSIINDLLDRSLRILIDCPCEEGCPGCLESYEIENTDFKKRELIEFIGGILKADDMKDALRWKFESIGTDDYLREDTLKLRDIRTKVFDILNKKAGIVIENPFDEKFMNADDRKWISESTAGLCHGGKETMFFRGGYKEAELIDLCAHEYIHNWQIEGNLKPEFYFFDADDIENENNIWFEGKIFLEGQANWGAAKVMDFFGIREMIFREEIKAYAQYREGLILINELERVYGLHKLISILKTGIINNNQSVTSAIIRKWYDDTGIKSMIQGLADQKITAGNMKCITSDYLDKTSDFNRITYFLNHEISPGVSEGNPLIKDILGTDNKNGRLEKVWEILKNHFKITVKKGYDFLPCINCTYYKHETLNGMCMMFGSISVKEEILRVIAGYEE